MYYRNKDFETSNNDEDAEQPENGSTSEETLNALNTVCLREKDKKIASRDNFTF